MTVIRGATTIVNDSQADISTAVQELLDLIFQENSLQKEEVKCIVFSLTSDIHSYHPAKAAREAGYDYAPLFAAVEPDIDGGLRKCIRVMLLTELLEKRTVKHIYERGAKTLRKDISEIFNIALAEDEFISSTLSINTTRHFPSADFLDKNSFIVLTSSTEMTFDFFKDANSSSLI